MVFTFDEFELDTERYELRQGGEARPVEPKVFDLLTVLVQRANEIVTRDDLLAAVWRGRIVSDTTISSCLKAARKALGDSGSAQRYISTVRGRGFRFTADIVSGDAATPSTINIKPTPVRELDPCLLMMCSSSAAPASDTAAYAEGLRHALGAVLMRVPLLRQSSEAEQLKQLSTFPNSQELFDQHGINFLLDVSLFDLGLDRRVAVELSDCQTGLREWTCQQTYALDAVPSVDECVYEIVADLEPQLHRLLAKQVKSAGAEESARGLYLRASEILTLRGWDDTSFFEAADLLRQSTDLDPTFAPAPAYLALVLGLGDRIGLIGGEDEHRAEVIASADEALRRDSNDSTVLGLAGCALADIGYEERALPLLEKAVSLSPINAQAWVALGSVKLLRRDLEGAVKDLRHGIQLSARDSRLGLWAALLALALLASKDLDGALQYANLACQDDRAYVPRVVLAGIHMVRGDSEKARAAMDDARRIKPNLALTQVKVLLGRRLGSTVLSL